MDTDGNLLDNSLQVIPPGGDCRREEEPVSMNKMTPVPHFYLYGDEEKDVEIDTVHKAKGIVSCMSREGQRLSLLVLLIRGDQTESPSRNPKSATSTRRVGAR